MDVLITWHCQKKKYICLLQSIFWVFLFHVRKHPVKQYKCLYTVGQYRKKYWQKILLWVSLHLCRVTSNIVQQTERSNCLRCQSGCQSKKHINEDFMYSKYTLLIHESKEQRSILYLIGAVIKSSKNHYSSCKSNY